jgi:hypothetical protein
MYMTLADPDYSEPHLANEVGDMLLEFCDEVTLRRFKSPKKEADSQGLDEEIEVSSNSSSSSTSQLVMQSSTSKLFEVLQGAIARKDLAEYKKSKPNIPVFKVPSNEDKSSETSSQTTREVSSSSSTQDLNAQAAHKSRMKYFGSLARYGVVSISTSKDASSGSSSQPKPAASPQNNQTIS